MPNQHTFEFDLFVSYATEDRAWVEGILLDALESAGVKVHTESTFALGNPRLEEFDRSPWNRASARCWSSAPRLSCR